MEVLPFDKEGKRKQKDSKQKRIVLEVDIVKEDQAEVTPDENLGKKLGCSAHFERIAQVAQTKKEKKLAEEHSPSLKKDAAPRVIRVFRDNCDRRVE